MCLFPKLVNNPKYRANKKNGGNIPPVPDDRVKLVPIGCGKCIECRKQKCREWQVRLAEDIKHHKNGRFVTLTFSTKKYNEFKSEVISKNPCEGYQLENEIATLAVRRFLEKWRKKFGKSVRHWLVTELGHTGTERIHLHGIIYCDNVEDVKERWGNGFVWTGKKEYDKTINYVSERTINYITKYINKVDELHKGFMGKVLCSAGIGRCYTEEKYIHAKHGFKNDKTDEAYRLNNGSKIGMPIYYRNKLYSDEEREKLWLMKLDKNVRYVLGEKIDIRQGLERYERALKCAQEYNKKIGYGDDNTDWKEDEYKRQIRIINEMNKKEKEWDKKNKKIEKKYNTNT